MKGFFLIELSVVLVGLLVILLGLSGSSSHAQKAIQKLRQRQTESPPLADVCTTVAIHDEQLIRCKNPSSRGRTVYFLGS